MKFVHQYQPKWEAGGKPAPRDVFWMEAENDYEQAALELFIRLNEHGGFTGVEERRAVIFAFPVEGER